MNRNPSSYDYRPTIILAAFVLFAFVLLVALLAPSAIPVVVTLPALVELVRLALKALDDR